MLERGKGGSRKNLPPEIEGSWAKEWVNAETGRERWEKIDGRCVKNLKQEGEETTREREKRAVREKKEKKMARRRHKTQKNEGTGASKEEGGRKEER